MPIFRLLVLFTLFFPVGTWAQGVQFVVDWTIPESRSEREQQLRQYKEYGFKAIQVEGVVDRATIELIQSNGFELWVSSGINFLRPRDFQVRQSLVDRLTDPIYYYRSNDILLHRYTLLKYPFLTTRTTSELSSYLNEVKSIYSGKIDLLTTTLSPDIEQTGIRLGYTIHSLEGSQFKDLDFNSVDYFRVPNWVLSQNSAREMRDLLTDTVLKDKIWLFDSGIRTQLESNPDLAKVIKGFSTNKEAIIALSPQLVEEDTMVVITITILILITLFLAIISTNASYQRSIVRYFLTHNFFINDVMMKRTRLSGALPLSWLLSLVFGILFFWITFDRVVNELTLEMLHYHYPNLEGILHGGVLTVISFSVLGLVMFQLISIVWVSASTYGKSTLSQVLQILFIPYQLIIPITIVASLSYLNSNSPVVLFYTFWLIIAILLISVPLTCADILGQNQGKKLIHWITGPFLYVLSVIATVFYILNYTSILETIQLITSLF